MRRHRNPYPSEFRREMIELVRAGRNPEELARAEAGVPVKERVPSRGEVSS
jgi:hypothetical protein